MASIQGPLDEVQFRHPALLAQMQGIHSNSVLFYFAESPFFDKTSNNAVLTNQAMFNPNMYQYIQTREAFEGRLKTMSGLEFVVAQEPAEMAPGTGTGVWVIRKQTRKKGRPGEEDEITVHATYYIVGENIYMAPSLADVLGFRMTHISSAVSKLLPTAAQAQTWTPATGHVYNIPQSTTTGKTRTLESKEATPLPETQSQGRGPITSPKTSNKATPDARLAEESFMIHMRFGGEYMDENPITGQPGQFQLSSTGRKEKLQIPGTQITLGSIKPPEAPDLGVKKDEKEAKTPKTPIGGLPKPKRKKSKAGTTPTSVSA